MNAEGELDIHQSVEMKIPNKTHCQAVSQLKATALKAYAHNILVGEMKPQNALAKVKQDFVKA